MQEIKEVTATDLLGSCLLIMYYRILKFVSIFWLRILHTQQFVEEGQKGEKNKKVYADYVNME